MFGALFTTWSKATSEKLNELLVGQFSLARKLRTQTDNRIIKTIFLEFILGSVTCGIRHGMPTIAIRAHFQKRRMRFFPDRIGDLSDFVAHFAKVHSID